MPTEIIMPQLTVSMIEGTITSWLKREGDPVQQGEALFAVETDKAVVEVTAAASGTLLKILVPAGGSANVNTPVALVAAPGEDGSSAPTGTASAGAVAAATSSASAAAALANAAVITEEPPATRQRVSPVARRVAQELGVDLSLIQPGPSGMIKEADVRRAYEEQQQQRRVAATPAPKAAVLPAAPTPRPEGTRPAAAEGTRDGLEERIPLAGIRKVMAEKMALSKRTAADATTVDEVDVTELIDLRQTVKIPVTAFVAKAVASALPAFPILNSSLVDDQVVIKKYYNLGVAVQAEHGLVVPVIREIDRLSLQEIANRIAELAAKARTRTLTLAELSGATFTVTNSGVFGSLLFTPVINPPEAAILGMGKIRQAPTVRDGQVVVRSMLYLCLTYDHRIIDGATAVTFVQKVKQHLEHPLYLNQDY